MISWDCKADDTKENFASILIESLVLFSRSRKTTDVLRVCSAMEKGMEADREGGTIYLKLTPLLKSWPFRGDTDWPGEEEKWTPVPQVKRYKLTQWRKEEGRLDYCPIASIFGAKVCGFY